MLSKTRFSWLILGMLMVAACASAEPPPHDDGQATLLLGRIYAGEYLSPAGEKHELTVTFDPELASAQVFELAQLFVERSSRPTLRTGLYYFDGHTLTLAVVEHDGEPAEQAPLVFRVENDVLTAEAWDTEWFNFESATLTFAEEVVLDE